MPSGDDKSRLNSRVFPSWRFSSSMSLTTPHFTRKPSSPQDFRLSDFAAGSRPTIPVAVMPKFGVPFAESTVL